MISHSCTLLEITLWVSKNVDVRHRIWYSSPTMSQDRLIKMVSAGDAKGVGKGHVYYTTFNNKNKKDPSKKHEERKFNPMAKTHTMYKQKK